MPLPVYVIGSSNTDLVIKSKKLAAPGETVIGGDFFMSAGGKGANQAVAAARLGGRVVFIANIGNDLFGRQALEEFRRENIDTRFVSMDDFHPSGVALIGVDESGQNCITVAPGSNGHLDVATIRDALNTLPVPAVALIQLEIPLAAVEYAVMACHEKGLLTILNPAPAQPLAPSVMARVDVITPNESEASILTGVRVDGKSSVREAARRLCDSGAKAVVITLGAKGAYMLSGGEDEFVSAPVVQAMDTTAAGDCFNGALAVALAAKKTMHEAVQQACQAAAISVTRLGAQSSMPTLAELEALSGKFVQPAIK